MYDLHLHSRYSDGDQTVAELIAAVAKANIMGCSLTDHNGTWGLDEAASAARSFGLTFVEGIELSARFYDSDVHILGYSQSFDRALLTSALVATRNGYEQRAKAVIDRCLNIGYPLTFDEVVEGRAGQVNPVYMTYDIARILTQRYGLSVTAARTLTTKGGKCYVPYGDWALTITEAIELVHAAGGMAVVAHPGTVTYEAGQDRLQALLTAAVASDVDGIEVNHPFHDSVTVMRLKNFVTDHQLVVTGGSDWHGPNRYHTGALGTSGISDPEWLAFQQRLQVRFPQH